MSQTLKKILLSIVILLILDSIYLSINYRLFADTVVNIQRVVMQVKPAGAFFVYLFIAFILNYFIILKNRSPLEAFALGFCVYGIFDGTNYAMLKKWPFEVALMDTTWGGILFGLTTYLTYMISSL